MKILVVAPHPDDETLGLGGTITRYTRAGHHVTIAILTGYGESAHPFIPKSSFDVVQAEARKACDVMGVQELIFLDLPAVLLPDEPLWKINKVVNDLLIEVQPDILFTPFLFDLHQDHRILNYAVTVAARPVTETGLKIQSIYTYEVVSETHWNISYLETAFTPNVWVDISDTLETKLEALRCYKSQMKPFPHNRSLEAIEALARFRGSQVSMHAAEGLVLVRQFCIIE